MTDAQLCGPDRGMNNFSTWAGCKPRFILWLLLGSWQSLLLAFPLLQALRVGRSTRGVEELDTATSHALDSHYGVA